MHCRFCQSEVVQDQGGVYCTNCACPAAYTGSETPLAPASPEPPLTLNVQVNVSRSLMRSDRALAAEHNARVAAAAARRATLELSDEALDKL